MKNIAVTYLADLTTQYREVRLTTEKLCAPLSPEDCTVQSMPNCSPVKWHLAHTSWFYETFLLEAQAENYEPFHPAFRVLYNSYYKTVGDQYPRPQRGLITRPSLDQVLAYRKYVDEAMIAFCQNDLPDSVKSLIALGLNHEQQHQELILTDLKHLFSGNPLYPVYRETSTATQITEAPLQWHFYDEGLTSIGYSGSAFAFDNEEPPHRVFIEAFELAGRLTTCREYLEFIEDGGYLRPELWLSDGWDTGQRLQWQAPLYWEKIDGRWHEFTLSGLREINLSAPVCHVSFYEADAFARWAGARLPTEMEWESVAANLSRHGNFSDSDNFHPIPLQSVSSTPSQMFGDVWEWTQSPYSPYPGFSPQPGALGEYNGKFMCNQMVLRGGSCVTPQNHIRATYRNFFPPETRWQFSGIRLARALSKKIR